MCSRPSDERRVSESSCSASTCTCSAMAPGAYGDGDRRPGHVARPQPRAARARGQPPGSPGCASVRSNSGPVPSAVADSDELVVLAREPGAASPVRIDSSTT